METVAATIRRITKKHIVENNGLLFAQNVTAVGWIGGTVPDDIPENKGIIELPTSDVSNSGIVIGAALVGKRPIYVIRFQGFLWYNLATLVNYAAKSKEMWNVPCPIFVRALGVEGSIGPVASNFHHSMVMRMPGINVVAPMTSQEWESIWGYYMTHDDPMFCSESRLSFGLADKLEDTITENAEITIFAISTSRLNAKIVIKTLLDQGIRCNLFSIVWLKPSKFSQESIKSLKSSKFGIVIDGDYEIAGASRSLAYELMHLTGVRVFALGLEDRTAGFAIDNITPTSKRIIEFIHKLGE